jgi:GT2 family glycosyltransferase
VGPLDPAFRLYAQDLDLCLRARAAGFAVAVVPVFAVLHHHGATVGQHPSAAGRQRVDLWVADVLAWAHKHRGPGWARRAAAVLRWGLVLRLAGRALHRPLLGRAARGPHDAFTTALHRARREARI